MSAKLGKARTCPKKIGKQNSLDNYMERTMDFQEFCEENDLNFRQTMLVAMRLYRLTRTRAKRKTQT